MVLKLCLMIKVARVTEILFYRQNSELLLRCAAGECWGPGRPRWLPSTVTLGAMALMERKDKEWMSFTKLDRLSRT